MIRKEQIPNFLTISRFFLALGALVFLNIGGDFGENIFLHTKPFTLIAACIFVVAAFTDFLDGYLSRKWNCVSSFGKVFDPVIDKFLIIGTLISLMVKNSVHPWVGSLLVVRDLLMDILRLLLYKKNIVVGAIESAKWKTCFQILGLTVILFFFSEIETSGIEFLPPMSYPEFWGGHIFLFVALFFSLYSFGVYLKRIFYDGRIS